MQTILIINAIASATAGAVIAPITLRLIRARRRPVVRVEVIRRARG